MCIISEAVNLLGNTSNGGNIAIKVDIAKAFNTLSWKFLLSILKAFGFDHVFCDWIHSILASAFLFISINGGHHYYFKCTRGVRLVDPLSPFLFCLAQDVLSRGISSLVQNGVLTLFKASSDTDIPSHIMYANDILLLRKAIINNIFALKHLFP